MLNIFAQTSRGGFTYKYLVGTIWAEPIRLLQSHEICTPLYFINPTIYNIIRWFAGPMGLTTRQTRVWCFKHYFFHKILQNSLQEPFPFFYETKCLVDESFHSFVPSAKQTSILYCRLSDFKNECTVGRKYRT